MRVALAAPSGVVPGAELTAGLERMRGAGLAVPDAAECGGLLGRHFVFAGSDEVRAAGFWDAAWDRGSEVVWCVRGGYGAARILPELERRTIAEGVPPRKLLCGYSDITALHEFVRSRWGWASLHCEMPAGKAFAKMSEEDFTDTVQLVRRENATRPGWSRVTLQPSGVDVLNDLAGTLVGGNLTVLASLVGTAFAVDNSGGRLLFLEDVAEAPYRLDRYLNQLWQGGVFRGVRAVVLGTFHDCHDAPSTTTSAAGGQEPVPVRPRLEEAEWARHVWGEFSLASRIPVMGTLPVGHGPEKSPLPLGAKYKLTGSGKLELLSWDWLEG